MTDIILTRPAADKLKEIMKQQGKSGKALRFGLVSQGCSSFVYNMDFEENPAEDDSVFEHHGIKIFVDQKSLKMLKGTTIDYNENEGGFNIMNPNTKSFKGAMD